MKERLLSLFLLSCSLSLTADVIGAQLPVTKDEALDIVMALFEDREVNYFIDTSSAMWRIFVDAEPMKGWEHECYLYSIAKSKKGADGNIVMSKTTLRLPPSDGTYEPVLLANHYENNGNQSPLLIKRNDLSAESLDAANRAYALIISGGVSKYSNHERYWNDCSFLYQTLSKRYCVPKSHIYPIMSDGTNPADDMLATAGYFKSQSLDLDGDGVNEIELSATKSNISQTLTSLMPRLEAEDHLFVFVIDHGGTTDGVTNSYINLWGDETLSDYELADMLAPFCEKNVSVNVVLGQCYAGGFVDNLERKGCVVATACKGDESSWGCYDIPYDEFVYQWTCAVSGSDHRQRYNDSNADTDGNGRITMKEAFEYAKLNDRVSMEHPQYASTPQSVGEDLAFNYLASAVDLYIKDNSDDTGVEPNTSTVDCWKSPSIWVRNVADGETEHENPIYTPTHVAAVIYVKIHNRGRADYKGGDYLHVYWAQASTGLSAKAWKGRELYTHPETKRSYLTGHPLEPISIPPISAGGYTIIEVNWALPALLSAYPDDNFHFCILAKIMDLPYDDGYVDGKVYFDVLGSNDQAQKNLTIIKKTDAAKPFYVYVRNIAAKEEPYSLELVPERTSDAEIFSLANIQLDMSPKITSAWENGGCLSENIEVVDEKKNTLGGKSVRFLSEKSKLKSIAMQSSEFDVVQLSFDFSRKAMIELPLAAIEKSRIYTLDLVQKDADGKIIGGETFKIEKGALFSGMLSVASQHTEEGLVELSAKNEGIRFVRWINQNGDVLSESESVTVCPRTGNDKYTVVTIDENGDYATGSISLETDYGIEDIMVAGFRCLSVGLKMAAPAHATITLVSTIDGQVGATYQVAEGDKELTLDCSGLSSGLYVMSYYVDAVLIDNQKIRLE